MNEENNKANQVDFYELNNLNLKPKIKGLYVNSWGGKL